MSHTVRVGIFVAGTLAIFAAGIFLIGNRQFRFRSTYRLSAEFQNVAGLDEGAAVEVGGMHQGTVRKIVLPQRPDQKIRVEMDLAAATRNVVKKDSVAAIRTEGLVGDQFVEVTFGSVGAASVGNDDTIGSEPPLQISDMMKKTNAILSGAQGAMQSVERTANNLQAITSKFNEGKGTAGALLNDRSVYEHINEATKNMQDDTEALKHNFLLRGFFKKRGYENQTDLQKHAISQIPEEDPSQRFSYLGSKLFDKPDGAKLKNSKTLDEAGHYLETARDKPIVIAAYADQKGDSDKQDKLTEARSAVVRDYLVKHFKLDDTRIRTIGLGKTQDAPDGGAVEILVYPPTTKVQQPGDTKKAGGSAK